MADGMKQRWVWADILRVAAAFSVILLHVAAPLIYQYETSINDTWWVANIYDSSVRFAVPVFVMLSGVLQLSRTYVLSEFFKKRFLRIFFPFVFWSLVYVGYNLGLNTNARVIDSEIVFVEIKDALLHGARVHFWFIYMLVGLYLIFPLVSKWLSVARNNEILYYLIIWFIVICLNMPFAKSLNLAIDFRYFAGYLGYAVLGYFLHTRINYRNKLIPLLFFVVGVLITLLGTYYYTDKLGYFYFSFYEYLSPNVLISAIGIFLLIRAIRFREGIFVKIMQFISKYTYGIFLVHILILDAFGHWGAYNKIIYQIAPQYSLPLHALMGFVGSFLLVFMVNKLPYIGRYISG